MVINTLQIIATLILLLIASAGKACADAIAHHPDKFPFKGKFWVEYDPHEKFIPFTKYPLTAWHIGNSLFWCGFLAIPAFIHTNTWFQFVVYYVISGIISIINFNLFYYHIFRKSS